MVSNWTGILGLDVWYNFELWLGTPAGAYSHETCAEPQFQDRKPQRSTLIARRTTFPPKNSSDIQPSQTETHDFFISFRGFLRLVGGLEHFLFSPIVMIQSEELICFRGVGLVNHQPEEIKTIKNPWIFCRNRESSAMEGAPRGRPGPSEPISSPPRDAPAGPAVPEGREGWPWQFQLMLGWWGGGEVDVLRCFFGGWKWELQGSWMFQDSLKLRIGDLRIFYTNWWPGRRDFYRFLSSIQSMIFVWIGSRFTHKR